jgi:serine/threonine protein kinase
MYRFFLDMSSYQLERNLYDTQGFCQCLPQLLNGHDNADGGIVSHSGYPFPPFIVLDRGTTLQRWLDVKRLPSAVLVMAGDVIERLVLLHSSGHVHRDLKPENVLFVFHTHQWHLLNFGFAAAIGVQLRKI